MDSSDSAAAAAAVSGNSSSSPPPPPPAAVVVSPCAACKILRRRCAEGCVLAPYFPPSDPLKFTLAHRVFGASNIIKLLQELPESQRSDAVSSMVYEANARVRDPVYGTAGAICQLQKQVNELQAQLAKAHAEIVNLRAQQANLLTLMCVEMGQMAQSPPPSSSPSSSLSSPESGAVDVGFPSSSNSCCFMDDESLASMWELPLWT